MLCCLRTLLPNFYPRSPRGGRLNHIFFFPHSFQFLSTPSARRATHRVRYGIVADSISIHALREEGDKRELHPRRTSRNFYPRPPRGGRPINHAILKAKFNFYPRPPRGGRLQQPLNTGNTAFISIHALREEGDYLAPHQKSTGAYFYPRPPRGGRRYCPLSASAQSTFLSTPSARRATSGRLGRGTLHHHFYPRPPRGGRPLALQHTVPHKPISIHALREEGDVRRSHHSCRSRISIHALREEGDLVQS